MVCFVRMRNVESFFESSIDKCRSEISIGNLIIIRKCVLIYDKYEN